MIKVKPKIKPKLKEVALVPYSLSLEYKYKRQPRQCDDNVRDTVRELLPNFLSAYVDTLTNKKLRMTEWGFNGGGQVSTNIFVYQIRVNVKNN